MTLHRLANTFVRHPLLTVTLALQAPFYRGRHVKVGFQIVDSDGGKGTEWLWCERWGYEMFEVDNLPFLVRKIAYSDVIQAGKNRDGWFFLRRRLASGLMNAWIFADGEDLRVALPRLAEGLEIKWEVASPCRGSVAGSGVMLTRLKTRIDDWGAGLFEFSAE
jgi:hypothetical protein